jgi:hypothetical protein
MPLDVALAPSPTTPGKYTFATGTDGDFYLDDKAVYPVLGCLFARKNEWRWAANFGTAFSSIKNSKRNTASQFIASGQDALSQAQLAGWISPVQAGSAGAQRDSAGRWGLNLRWLVPSGSVSLKVDF